MEQVSDMGILQSATVSSMANSPKQSNSRKRMNNFIPGKST